MTEDDLSEFFWKYRVPIGAAAIILSACVVTKCAYELIWNKLSDETRNRITERVRYHIGEFGRYTCSLRHRRDKSKQICFDIRGLSNLGNTCYFNSVMQPLSHTYILNEELEAAKGGELKQSFFENSNEVLKKISAPCSPDKVRDLFIERVRRFDNDRQHDSHECLRHFLDEIRKEEKAAKASSGDKDLLMAVDKVFGGHLITVYNCKECDKYYHLFEPCLDLSLPVFLADETMDFGDENRKENYESNEQEFNYRHAIQKLTTRLTQSAFHSSYKREISLLDCLRHFSREEQIYNEYLCTDCLNEAMGRGEASEENLKLTSATKQTLIFNPPAVLTIHFKRFELLEGGAKKRSDFVSYPEFLDISSFCSAECLRNDPPRSNIWYSLYAVVVHSGSLEFGHYVAYVKLRERMENIRILKKFLQQKHFNHNASCDDVIEMLKQKNQQERTDRKVPMPDESRWYLLDDSSVYKVNINEVLSREAYLLFYERFDDKEKVVPKSLSAYGKYPKAKSSDEETDEFDDNPNTDESKGLIKHY